ncbi:MAG: hypothetical protein GHCLOJNM_01555 [bacterium]|nr:hypothetical protein [bacterium]
MSWDASLGPSEHLTWGEVECRCGCGLRAFSPDAAALFERIRSKSCVAAGRDCPIHVESGVRCPAHNASVGGKEKSRHLFGDALDLWWPKYLTHDMFAFICESECRDSGYHRYRWGCHVDARRDRARW